MSNNYSKMKKGILFFSFFSISQFSSAQDLMHYWNFNNNASVAAITTPSQTLGGASINAIAGGISNINFAEGVNQNFNVLNINAQNGDAHGTHLRFDDPIGGTLVFALPTSNYENVIVKFATRRSAQGAGSQLWSYSLNGTTFTSFETIAPNNGDPALATLDFSAISEADNNPNFKLKVEFVQGSGGTGGNNRFDNFTMNGTSIGGEDTTAPNVAFLPANASTNIVINTNPTLTFNENVRLIDDSAITNNNVASLVELRMNNSTGAAVPFTATFASNVITIVPSSPLTNSQNYYVALLPNVVEDLNDNAITTVKSAEFTTAAFDAKISMASNFVTVEENAGTLNFVLNLVSPTTGSVDLVVKGTPFSTADANDFTLVTQTLNFTAGSPLTHTIQIPIIDDTAEEQQAEYFVLALENPVNFSITGNPEATIYIKDNDRLAPVPNQDITLEYVGSFDPSGNRSSTCEIVVHDPASQRLFTTSAVAGYLDIIDFSNPTELNASSIVSSINMNSYGGVTSVAVKNGIVAVASPNANEALDGSVVFFTTDGVFLKQVTVGALPDMITFTPDGTKVLTANEGQPNADYSVDPEGSVSVIDISGGIANLTQNNVTTMYFTQFNSQETALIESGVRKLKSTSTLSQDLEPEYITISADSQKAWVALQENNAIAEINLANNTYTSLWVLGTKDMSIVGNGADISDNNGQVLIANWPIKSFYQPDGIASYTANGSNFIVTANEGDEKEYTGFVERIVVGAANYTLDPVAYPQASMLKQNHNAGRFRASAFSGQATGNPASFEQIYALGSRSFSIFNAETKEIVFDSGDDFEMYTAFNPTFSSIFNSDHEANGFKTRSRAKGPEPEGVTLATIAGKTFAFIGLERIGGVMVYDVTNPNDVKFVDYKNNRTVSAYAGDHGPEGITFVSAANSPNNKDYVIVANEISGTLTLFEVNSENLSTPEYDKKPKTFVLFPNPASDGIVYFNRVADIEVYDFTGKLIHSEKQALTINTASLSSGIYLVKTSEGITKKLVVK